MKRLAGLILLAAVVGCVEHKLTIDSEPRGALVYVNNQEIGRTPITREFTYYGNFDVQLRADGYETLKTHKWIVAPIWNWVPFDLVAELIPVTLKDSHTAHFTMKPAATQPLPSSVVLWRAIEMRSLLESGDYTRQPTTNPTAENPVSSSH